jgi:hypothetical protein
MKRQGGAILSLPVDARGQDTGAKPVFGTWMLQHIDSWFSFARGLGLVDQMEDIILVTGFHRTKSCANVVFLEKQTLTQVSFAIKMTHGHGAQGVSIEWDFPLGNAQGAMYNQGPEGNLNVCHFERDIDFRKSEMALT